MSKVRWGGTDFCLQIGRSCAGSVQAGAHVLWRPINFRSARQYDGALLVDNQAIVCRAWCSTDENA